MPRAEPLLDGGVEPRTGMTYRSLGMGMAFLCVGTSGYLSWSVSTISDNGGRGFLWMFISLCGHHLSFNPLTRPPTPCPLSALSAVLCLLPVLQGCGLHAICDRVSRLLANHRQQDRMRLL